MPNGKNHPPPEYFEIEIGLFLPCSIDDRVFVHVLIIDILFKSISKQTRPRGPHSIVKSLKPICKEYLARKSVFKRKVNLSEHEHYIFVEIVTNKPTNSPVSPPTMAQ
jgi:hypothetical protein